MPEREVMRGIPSVRFARLAPWFLSATLLLFTGQQLDQHEHLAQWHRDRDDLIALITNEHAASAPPHAFAWFQIDGAHVPQIWASVNGGTRRQITHVLPASDDCVNQIAWRPPVFSPDLRHETTIPGIPSADSAPHSCLSVLLCYSRDAWSLQVTFRLMRTELVMCEPRHLTTGADSDYPHRVAIAKGIHYVDGRSQACSG